jgi:hypothetical protein
MREESHLDEMRTAIRGDFERLAERRGEQELMRVSEHEPPPQAAEPALELPATAVLEPGPQPQPVADPAVEPEDEVEDEAVPRRSWLARFLSP